VATLVTVVVTTPLALAWLYLLAGAPEGWEGYLALLACLVGVCLSYAFWVVALEAPSWIWRKLRPRG